MAGPLNFFRVMQHSQFPSTTIPFPNTIASAKNTPLFPENETFAALHGIVVDGN